MRFNKIAKWKIRLADYFSWLRDEDWYAQKREEAMARLPWLGAVRKTLVEVHTFERPFLGRIYKATFRDGSDGYLAEVFEPAQSELDRGLDEQRLARGMLEGQGYPSKEIYSSLEDARPALPELLRRASDQKRNTATFTDKQGRTWLPYLPEAEKKG